MKYKNTKIISIFLIVGIISIVLGVSIAFFNYTRTGGANNLGTGTINFNSTQSNTLNITNAFPVKSTNVNANSLDSVTVVITGDTSYVDGEEFEITLSDVNNTINDKQIPLNYIATYTASTGGSIGTSNSDYWEDREDKNANIYLLNGTGDVHEGKQVLVGYIDNGQTGINGTLTIKAYIDADRIAISDTYYSSSVYEINTSNVSACVSYMTSLGYNQGLQPGETLNAFCLGTGTLYSETFNEWLDSNAFPSSQIEYMIEHNIITYLGENGTTSEWVAGRTVFTTSEWNSFQASGTPISFKIKAESNEGIWVPAQGTIESCPNCKFMYYVVVDPNDIATAKWTTWNNQNQTPTQITSGLYDNYEELIEATGKNYFLGVRLNSNNEVTNAYACGVKDNEPFCLEGTSDGSKYSANSSLINGSSLWNNTCDVESNYTECGPWDGGSVSARANSDGYVYAGVSDNDHCFVYDYGTFGCFESDSGGGGK